MKTKNIIAVILGLMASVVILSACKKKTVTPVECEPPVPIVYTVKVYNMRPGVGAKTRKQDDSLLIMVNRMVINQTYKDTSLTFNVNALDTVSVYWYPGFMTNNHMRISLNGNLLFKCDTLANTKFKHVIK